MAIDPFHSNSRLLRHGSSLSLGRWAAIPTFMHKTITHFLSIILWLASMFIKLAEFQSRGETHRIHIYTFYGWIVAVAYQPKLLFAAFGAWILFLLVDLLHFVFCFALAYILVWLGRRFFVMLRPPPNNALQRTGIGGGAV